jgi:hypothetical protein
MKSPIVFLLLLSWCLSHAQAPTPAVTPKSAGLKKLANYLPSLTEVGYVTGAINCYLQAAALVRTVNREIALAKSLNDRLDALQNQASDMYSQFEDLKNINPYDMDSWAGWLQRADNLAGYEMSQFTFILGDQILTTIDDKMTRGFAREIQRARSYEVRDGNFQDVLNRYFMRTTYVDYRRTAAQGNVNHIRMSLTAVNQQLRAMRQMAPVLTGPLQDQVLDMIKQLEVLAEAYEAQLRVPHVFDETAIDRQIAFVSDMAQSLAHDFDMLQEMLAKHMDNIKGLNVAWRETLEGRLAKDKRADDLTAPLRASRPEYDDADADKAPFPVNDPDKPTSANVSHTGSPTSMADILFLQNKIDFERLAIARTALLMDLLATNAKSTFVASESGKRISAMNARSSTTFGAENVSQFIKKGL